MAKVIGPLHSDGASGKFADAMVFFRWKGRNVVRQYIIPENPQSDDQAEFRTIVGGTGRAVGKIKKGSDFHAILIALKLVPTDQTKQSYLVKFIIDNYLATPTAYATQLASLKAHSASISIGTVADSLLITEFDIDYGTIDAYDKRLGVYLIAKAAVALNFTGASYTKAIADWTAAGFESMAEDFTTIS